jgi:hypothetical protein
MGPLGTCVDLAVTVPPCLRTQSDPAFQKFYAIFVRPLVAGPGPLSRPIWAAVPFDKVETKGIAICLTVETANDPPFRRECSMHKDRDSHLRKGTPKTNLSRALASGASAVAASPRSAGHVKKPDLLGMRAVEHLDRFGGGLQ